VAYSIVILPDTTARYLQFNHHHVSLGASFFANTMFNLSGALDVVLFLIIRPELLLFPRPRELDEQEVQLTPSTPQGTGPAIISDREKFQSSPEPSTSAALGDRGSKDIAAPSHVISRRLSDEI
jgi:hypothetical protein